MIGSILKVLAYRQAPKTTFAMLHPDAAFQMAKMQYDFHHAYAPRVAAIAAAAVALPLGILLGRAMERGARRYRNRAEARMRSHPARGAARGNGARLKRDGPNAARSARSGVPATAGI